MNRESLLQRINACELPIMEFNPNLTKGFEEVFYLVTLNAQGSFCVSYYGVNSVADNADAGTFCNARFAKQQAYWGKVTMSRGKQVHLRTRSVKQEVTKASCRLLFSMGVMYRAKDLADLTHEEIVQIFKGRQGMKGKP